jgi:rhamnose utilization protein RhaD (predicted bifunctional aldolase and dehydrogenase)
MGIHPDKPEQTSLNSEHLTSVKMLWHHWQSDGRIWGKMVSGKKYSPLSKSLKTKDLCKSGKKFPDTKIRTGAANVFRSPKYRFILLHCFSS